MPSRTRGIAAPLISWLLATAALITTTPAMASDQLDPVTYPELAPAAVLPAILAELRHTLPDIYSVREMRLCPAIRIKLKDGKPTDWAIRFEFNAKNQNGGYAGIRREVAIFRDGRIKYPIGNSPQLGREGLDGVFSKMVDKQMAPCTAIPDATVQQVLQAAR